MKQNIGIKSMVLLLSFSAASLTGCQSAGTQETSSADTILKAENCAYQAEAVTNAIDGQILLGAWDDTLYTLKLVNEETVYDVCHYPRAGETVLFSYTPGIVGDSVSVQDFSVLSENMFAFLLAVSEDSEKTDEEANDYVTTYFVEITDETGAIQNDIEVDCGYQMEGDGSSNLVFFSDASAGALQTQFLSADGVLSDAAAVSELSNLYGMARGADGSVMALGSSDSGESELLQWNAETGSFVPLEITLPETVLNIFSSANPEALAYLQDSSGIYAIAEDGTVTEEIDFVESGLTLYLSGFLCEADGTYDAVLYRENYTNPYLAQLTPKEETDDADVRTLTFGCAASDSDIIEYVQTFNSSQETYRIQMVDYTSSDTIDLDIAAGNIPDIISVDYLDRYRYAEKGLFRNLYDMMETDEDLPKEAFLENYLTANEVDGALYWIAPTFSVDTVFVNDNLTGGLDSWDYDQFLEIAESCNEQGIEILGFQDQIGFMDLFLTGESYLDIENKTSYFQDASFLRALELSENLLEYVEPDSSLLTESEYEAAISEDAAKWMRGERLIQAESVHSFEDYVVNLALFGDEPVRVIGYPTRDGSAGSYFTETMRRFGITESCDDPDGAWDFIKCILDTSVNEDIIQYELPTEIEKLEFALEESIDAINGVTFSYNNLELDLPTVTEADTDAFMAWLKTIETCSVCDTSVEEIINETMQDYYDGNQTAEETADFIQQKIGLYLKENA